MNTELLNKEVIRINNWKEVKINNFILNKSMCNDNKYIWLIDKDDFYVLLMNMNGLL